MVSFHSVSGNATKRKVFNQNRSVLESDGMMYEVILLILLGWFFCWAMLASLCSFLWHNYFTKIHIPESIHLFSEETNTTNTHRKDAGHKMCGCRWWVSDEGVVLWSFKDKGMIVLLKSHLQRVREDKNSDQLHIENVFPGENTFPISKLPLIELLRDLL